MFSAVNNIYLHSIEVESRARGRGREEKIHKSGGNMSLEKRIPMVSFFSQSYCPFRELLFDIPT